MPIPRNFLIAGWSVFGGVVLVASAIVTIPQAYQSLFGQNDQAETPTPIEILMNSEFGQTEASFAGDFGQPKFKLKMETESWRGAIWAESLDLDVERFLIRIPGHSKTNAYFYFVDNKLTARGIFDLSMSNETKKYILNHVSGKTRFSDPKSLICETAFPKDDMDLSTLSVEVWDFNYADFPNLRLEICEFDMPEYYFIGYNQNDDPYFFVQPGSPELHQILSPWETEQIVNRIVQAEGFLDIN